jgi:hypothetical protein
MPARVSLRSKMVTNPAAVVLVLTGKVTCFSGGRAQRQFRSSGRISVKRSAGNPGSDAQSRTGCAETVSARIRRIGIEEGAEQCHSQPCAGSSDQRFPVIADREQDRHARLNGTLAIQLRVEHPEAENEDGERGHDADPEDDAPDRVEVGVQTTGGFKDDQVENAGKDGSEREDEVLRRK